MDITADHVVGFAASIDDKNALDIEVECKKLADAIDRIAPDLEEALQKLLKSLIDKRQFRQCAIVAEAAIKSGSLSPWIWTSFAFCLIELGQKTQALSVLDALWSKKAEHKDIEQYVDEIYGLKGRAWKDIAFEAVNGQKVTSAQRALEQSARFYKASMEASGDIYWGGAQLVALSAFDRKQGVSASLSSQDSTAEKIIASVKKMVAENDPVTPWQLGSACEMSVALNKPSQALEWANRVQAHPDCKVLNLASLYRNVMQMYAPATNPEYDALRTLLLDAINRRGGGYHLALGGHQSTKLEAIIGRNGGPVSLAAINEALRCAKSVVSIRNNFSPHATGFVVNAVDVGLSEEHGLVVVTNAHAVSNPPETQKAIAPGNVSVLFESVNGSPSYRIKSILCTLPMRAHDCVILKLAGRLPDEAAPLTTADLPNEMPPNPIAYVIGHPLGQQVSFSLLDSELIGYAPFKGAEPQVMQYRSPTDFGSSGSPVFNANWQVIGLHRGFNTMALPLNGKASSAAANEGVSIASIKAAVAAQQQKG